MGSVKAFVLGYTGETGKALVKELSRDGFFSSVVLIGRRKADLPEECGTKFVQETVDFDKIEEYSVAFKDCTVGFCCMGTTRGKAGPKDFVKVDRDYVVNCATVAKGAGCQHFHLVSSQGANKNSILLYPKTKGQVEEKVTEVQFPKCSIYRPAFLLCDRVESRPGEKFIKVLLKPLIWLAPTQASIPVETIARAMISRTKQPAANASEIVTNVQIHELGKSTKT